MGFDVASVRGLYASLGEEWTYLNAHDAPQVPVKVDGGIVRALRTANNRLSREESGSHRRLSARPRFEGDLYLAAARAAVADLVGATADRVVLGPSLEHLYRDLIRAMRPVLRYDSSVVLSRHDRPALHRALDTPAARTVVAEPDLATGLLPAGQYDDIVDRTTRLVSFPAAHDLLGTITPVKEIVSRAHAHSRLWVLVDATAYASYRLAEAEDWDADIIGLDVAALGGPQLGALVFRDPRMVRRLDALNPAAPEGSVLALESPVSAALAGGVAPLVEHIARLGGAGESGPRRARLKASAREVGRHFSQLARELVTFLASLPAVHVLGVSGEEGLDLEADRLPRLSFMVEGVPAETVQRRLTDNGLLTTLAPESLLLDAMGVREAGGAVTVSLAAFNRVKDVEHLTRAVASLA